MEIRGSNRAVQEYADELRRAEHELEQAQERVATLKGCSHGHHEIEPAPIAIA